MAQVAAELTPADAPPREQHWTEIRLGALMGRLMYPGGLTAASRHAGAEPIWTGRTAPYDESSLRRFARRLEQTGAVPVLSRAVQRQVERAVEASGTVAVGHTDMYDQVHWSKKSAHAAPIGGRANQLLGAVYIGLTTVRLGGEGDRTGPVLAYHASWHKPASPLVDALKELHADPQRHAWLTTNLGLHIWDRGGNGVGVLTWSREQRIPYLTVANGWVYLSSQKRPTLLTPDGHSVFVRRDVRLPTSTDSDTPAARIVIFPARPDLGERAKRGLRYPTNADLSVQQLEQLNVEYKSRWPAIENQIKGLIADGFGVNRTRILTKTTSRGHDGKLARSVERETELLGRIARARKDPSDDTAFAEALKAFPKIIGERVKREQLEVNRVEKGARLPGHGELLCKNLMLLMHNALVLLLAKSPIEAVRAMTCQRVRALLLAQPALTLIERGQTTLCIQQVTDAEQRPLQQELVRLFNERVTLRMRDGPKLTLRLMQLRGIKRR